MLARWTPPSAGHRLLLVGRFAEAGEVVEVPDGVVHPWLIPVEPVVETPAAPAEVPEPIEPPAKRSRRKGQN